MRFCQRRWPSSDCPRTSSICVLFAVPFTALTASLSHFGHLPCFKCKALAVVALSDPKVNLCQPLELPEPPPRTVFPMVRYFAIIFCCPLCRSADLASPSGPGFVLMQPQLTFSQRVEQKLVCLFILLPLFMLSSRLFRLHYLYLFPHQCVWVCAWFVCRMGGVCRVFGVI